MLMNPNTPSMHMKNPRRCTMSMPMNVSAVYAP